MQENEYQIIVALVNQGYSEEVMAAARPAGAAGGTVLHSRRVGAEEALSQWGFSLQEGKGSRDDPDPRGEQAGDHAGDLR